MLHRKPEKEPVKGGKRVKDKILSPNILQMTKNKVKNNLSPPIKNISKHHKTFSRLN